MPITRHDRAETYTHRRTQPQTDLTGQLKKPAGNSVHLLAHNFGRGDKRLSMRQGLLAWRREPLLNGARNGFQPTVSFVSKTGAGAPHCA